jgi:mannobiose 2-epimerase
MDPERAAVNPGATLRSLEREMRSELTERILPFWGERVVDQERGGFYGYIGPDGKPDPEAPRGAILNSRILWTFSAASQALRDPALAALAGRAAQVIRNQFLDGTHGGVYWMVDASGHPVDDRKHVYAQAFAIYGLAEHYRATGSQESLADATKLFRLIETQARDEKYGGYREGFSRDWRALDDVRLGETDLNAPRSANTHLHLLEAYTTLYRAWPDSALASRLRALLELFLDRIAGRATGHLRPFFDEDWTPCSDVVSYGHDIEASWLMSDAAAEFHDPELSAGTRETALLLADTVLREGLDPMGGVFYMADPGGKVDKGKEWWTQAEAVVGFLNAYQETQRLEFLEAARDTWEFIKGHMLDHERGEWYRRVDSDGTPAPGHEIVGPWKCPYHNARACLEVMRRAQ